MKAKEDSRGQGSQPQEEILRLRWRHQWFDALTLSRGKSGIGLPRWLSGKESACQAGDTGSVPALGRSPGEENDNPLQYSCLENSTDRGAWWATGHGVTKSQTRLRDQHLIQNWWLIKLIIDTQGFVMVCSLLSFWLEILHDTFFKRFASRRGKVLISSLKKCLIPPLLT